MAPVGALDEVGFIVAEFMGIQNGVDGIDIVKVGRDVIDKGRPSRRPLPFSWLWPLGDDVFAAGSANFHVENR